MDHSEFMTLVRAVYTSLLNCIGGLQVQNNSIVEVCQMMQLVYTLNLLKIHH